MYKLIRLVFITAILFMASESHAQKAKAKLAYEMRDLNKLIGIWESSATITVDSVPHKVTYRMNFRKTADGYGMNMDEAYSDSVLGNMRGSCLIGFGYNDSKIHWYCVDNMGHSYERIGQWNDSDNLSFTYTSKQGDKKYDEVLSYAFKGNDEFTYSHAAYLDGKELKKVTGKFKRRVMSVPQPRK